MNFWHLVCFALAVLLATKPVPVHADENLLARPDAQFLIEKSVGIGLDGVLRVKDGDVETSSLIEIQQDEPVELVFSFAGKTVTPKAFNVNATGLTRDSVLIELLVSEQDADTGFLTLRDQPLRDTKNWQRFPFEPAAAKWMIVKISTFGDPISFDLNELEVVGYEGTPTSSYAFDEAPAEAFDVLVKLKASDVELNLHPDELALFEDAKDGSLDNWSFAEASLLSSSVYASEDRNALLGQIETMTAEAESVVAAGATPFEKGELLLSWLHKGAMNKGYVEAQTDMSTVLRDRVFNCVSSATLYNILARRIGLDARGIEVPDHAFSILYDGTAHVDVETTTPKGFNPARSKAAVAAFARTTGFSYIRDTDRSKRREIDDAGMVALTYYNHGVNATQDGDYALALTNYFKALSLDPRNKSAIKNTIYVLNNWAQDALETKDFSRAVEVLDVGLSLAPKDHSLRHNMRYALQEAMLTAQSTEETQTLVERAHEISERTGDSTIARVYSNVFQRQAMAFVALGQYEDALSLTEKLGPNPSERLERDAQRLRSSIFLTWSNDMMDRKDFEQAVEVLARGLNEPKVDYRVKNNLAFAAQEWAQHISETKTPEEAQATLIDLAKRFPKIRGLQNVAARNYAIDGLDAYESGDFARAIEIFQTAQKLGIDASRMKRNEEASWLTWSSKLLDEGDHAAALSVLEQSLVANPKNYKAKNNIAYIVQEWAKGVAEDGNTLEAEKIVFASRERFPSASKLGNLQSSFVGRAVNAATAPEDFEALADTVHNAASLAKSSSKYDQLVTYFYATWAKTVDEKFVGDEAIAILQAGVERHPKTRKLTKLFVQAVNFNGETAMANGEWAAALAIFKSALRTVPNERGIQKNIEACEERL